MATPASTDTTNWYAQGINRIYDRLEADSAGLSREEAANRRDEHGPNRLPKAEPVTVWEIFIRQFRNPLIYILAIAAIVSFAIGEGTDAGFITAVLLINALVGGVQEWRAERSSQALQELVRTRATVIRDGRHATSMAKTSSRVTSSSSNRGTAYLLTFDSCRLTTWRLTSRHSRVNQKLCSRTRTGTVTTEPHWAIAATWPTPGPWSTVGVDAVSSWKPGPTLSSADWPRTSQPSRAGSRRWSPAWSDLHASSDSPSSLLRQLPRYSGSSSSSTTPSKYSSLPSRWPCRRSPKGFQSGSPSR